MMKIKIDQAEFVGDGWFVRVIVENEGGSLSGPHILPLPEDATPKDIEQAVAAIYS